MFWKKIGMGNKESQGAGGPPPSKASTGRGGGGGSDHVINAITVQKDAASNLEKKIQQLQLRVDNERKQAKVYISAKTDKTANQNKAKRHLLNARRLQNQIAKFEGMRDNLETVQNALESAAITKTIHSTMAVGSNALKSVKTELDPDKLADLTDELQENTQVLEEATNLISQPIGNDPGLDLDVDNDMADLLAEMDDEEEVVEAPVVKTKKPAPRIPTLPAAPTSKVVMTPVEDEEEQLNALMRDMS
jgi:myosin heavy subunit